MHFFLSSLMIIRNITISSFITLILITAYILTYHQNLILHPELPLLPKDVSLKSIYHHAPNKGPFRYTQQLPITTTQNKSFRIKTTLGKVYKPTKAFRERLDRLNKENKLMRWQVEQSQWEPIIAILPDVQDHETILSLGEMTYNAYYDTGKGAQWYDLGEDWHVNSTFGWDANGLRGHVFGNADDSLLVISFKGTTAGLYGEPTGDKDKFNDNLLFSCCCGKVSRGWTPICECNDDKVQYQCDSQCLDQTVKRSDFYYDYGLKIFLDVAGKYPKASIILTGHSLGGAVAALVGQTYGVPAVSFESPGDRLAAQRLHLPHEPGAKDVPIWHFGNTADPIFIGVCTGPLSGCYYAGFAMEAGCHTGKVCAWDTVKDNGWKVNVAYHRIGTVVESILKKPKEFPLPKCKVEDDCQDCGLWTFKDDRDALLSKNSRQCNA